MSSTASRGTRLVIAASLAFASLTAIAPAGAVEAAGDANGREFCISAGAIVEKTKNKSDRSTQAIPLNVQLQTFKAGLATRTIAVKAINDAFTAALLKAKSEYKKAKAKATSPSMLSAAESARKAATDAAIASRQAAIDLLPPLPLDPSTLPICSSQGKSGR